MTRSGHGLLVPRPRFLPCKQSPGRSWSTVSWSGDDVAQLDDAGELDDVTEFGDVDGLDMARTTITATSAASAVPAMTRTFGR